MTKKRNAITALAASACALLATFALVARGEEPVLAPAPAFDAPKAKGELQTAVLAGGCFWGVEGVYEHVRGVQKVESGYSGGTRQDAHYDIVSEGGTGHAESVRIAFDPAELSYGEILRIFFSVVHDPTTLNRQGPDSGTQYRSAIFVADAQQREIATRYIAQLEAAKVFGAPIVTRVVPFEAFYPAEAYHQDFLERNPTYPYIVFNDLPKIRNLKKLFPAMYREQTTRS